MHMLAPCSVDVWLILGISGYLTGLFIEDTFGKNEYRFYLYQVKHQTPIVSN